MSVKILLAADIHLGLKFSAYSEIQKELAQARYDTLRSLIQRANSEECDLFVIAGDLFDHHRVPEKEIVICKNILSEFQGKVCLVLPGNHDFYQSDSKLWARFNSTPADRVLLLQNRTTYSLEHYGVNAMIYASPCDAKHSRTNATDWVNTFPKDDKIQFHIGIAHGSLKGISPDPDGNFFPMDEAVLSGAGVDLWLMGHTDRLQYPATVGRSNKVFYPGTHEPNGFNCQHEGKAWLLELADDKTITAESISCGKFRFVEKSISVLSFEELERAIEQLIAGASETMLLHLSLEGSLPKQDFARIQELEAKLHSAVFHLEVQNNIRSKITKELIDSEFTSGSFPHTLLTTLSSHSSGGIKALQLAYDLIREVKHEN